MVKYFICALLVISISGCIFSDDKKETTGIPPAVYKSEVITSNVTYNYDDGTVITGTVIINLTLNLKSDKTYSSTGTLKFLIEGETLDLENSTSGTWTSTNSQLCTDGECEPVRNLNSYSFETFIDMTGIEQGDGFTFSMDFAGWVKMNKQ